MIRILDHHPHQQLPHHPHQMYHRTCPSETGNNSRRHPNQKRRETIINWRLHHHQLMLAHLEMMMTGPILVLSDKRVNHPHGLWSRSPHHKSPHLHPVTIVMISINSSQHHQHQRHIQYYQMLQHHHHDLWRWNKS